MTEGSQNETNIRIAEVFFGWTRGEADTYIDQTGDKFSMPPNYSDNSGLMVGLEYKLRARGFTLSSKWPSGEAWEYTISQDGHEHTGVANRKAEALTLAVQDYFKMAKEKGIDIEINRFGPRRKK